MAVLCKHKLACWVSYGSVTCYPASIKPVIGVVVFPWVAANSWGPYSCSPPSTLLAVHTLHHTVCDAAVQVTLRRVSCDPSCWIALACTRRSAQSRSHGSACRLSASAAHLTRTQRVGCTACLMLCQQGRREPCREHVVTLALRTVCYDCYFVLCRHSKAAKQHSNIAQQNSAARHYGVDAP